MPYTVSIPTTSLSTDPNSNHPFTVYHLTLTTPLRKTVLHKRYSDFANLHTSLTSSCAAAPPASLPAKSWFTRTVNNPGLTEKRRQGLEAYVQAIESAPEAKWRDSGVWRAFLGFPPSDGAKSRRSTEEARAGMSAGVWLELHGSMKQLLQDARSLLAKRENAPTTTAAHEASAQAKKALVKAHTLILRLEEGLKGLADGKGGEKLGEGEVRRRRDLVARARKEREALEGVLNAWVARGSSVSSTTVGESTFLGHKQELFSGSRNSPPTRSSAGGVSMAGTFPAGSSVPRTGRVLGGPAKETDRTRELDNEGVLQLQKQVMKEQDMDVEDLAKVVRKMKDMGVAINEELVEQGQLLDVLDQDMDRVSGKIDIAKKRIRKIN